MSRMEIACGLSQRGVCIPHYLPPAPSSPSGVIVSQNGVDSVQVSWTPPSGEPPVTGYIIYYHQQDGRHTGSVMARATATTATIAGLIPGATYSITMMATSSMLPSTVTAAKIFIIGNCMGDKCMDSNYFNFYRDSHHLPHLLSILLCHGWRQRYSHLLCHFTYWSNWYSRLPLGGA